jgi:hypothetical protein
MYVICLYNIPSSFHNHLPCTTHVCTTVSVSVSESLLVTFCVLTTGFLCLTAAAKGNRAPAPTMQQQDKSTGMHVADNLCGNFLRTWLVLQLGSHAGVDPLLCPSLLHNGVILIVTVHYSIAL